MAAKTVAATGTTRRREGWARPGWTLVLLTASCFGLSPLARSSDEPAATDATRDSARIARTIEFWTIEPNEGQSAGGHSAVRIGDRIHHLEHREDGLLLDRRDPRGAFERTYRFEGNRGIDVLRLDLPPEVESDLVARLDRRRFERRIRIDRLGGLEAEVAWLDAALESGRAAVTVPALGLLDSEARGCHSDAAAPLASLREELRARLGPDTLEHRLVGARRALARARDRLMADPTVRSPASRSSAPVGGVELEPGGPVRRLVEAVQTVAGLESILHCRGPSPSRIRSLHGAPLASRGGGTAHDSGREGGDDGETEGRRLDEIAAGGAVMSDVVRSLKARLLGDLAQLIRSDRPDPGLALLLGWARLVVLEHSLAEGRLAVLDPFAEGDSVSSLRALGVSEARIRERARAAQRVFDARWIDLAESALPAERRLERLESARHDLAHALLGQQHRAPERPADGTRSLAVRYASAEVDLAWSRGVTLRSLAARRDAAREQARRFRRSIERDLDYDLFSRNCSTELLEVLEEALASDPATADFGSARRRDPEALTSFIPVVAGRVVARNAPVASRTRLPGFRALAIERAAREDAAGWVALQESNTITSQIYRPNPKDSIFVFFSGEPIWIRPLAGIGNLIAGLGGAGAGLLVAPWDGGERWLRGVRGIAMSVPELFFFSVRKGSFVVAPDWTLPGTESRPSGSFR